MRDHGYKAPVTHATSAIPDRTPDNTLPTAAETKIASALHGATHSVGEPLVH